jgi:AraC-like DNA-binding protein
MFKPQLIVPYKKSVTSYIGNAVNPHQTMSGIIVGQMRHPVNIEAEPGGGTIGIEFKPSSAYLFFKTDLHTFTDQVWNSHDVWGSSGDRMKEQLGNIETVEGKVECLQNYLLGQVQDNYSNRVVDYVVKKIVNTSGFVSISRLSEDICYSRQHLTRLFSEYIGVSPKEFARIARFQQFYSRINAGADYEAPDDLYDHYYDQSHYIKEFQKYVGYTPGEYKKIQNEFGKIFYREKDVPFLQ